MLDTLKRLLRPAERKSSRTGRDRIEALGLDRAALWERVTKAPFLTVNEKRAATGYGAIEGGDVLTFQAPRNRNKRQGGAVL